jgi:hypothetical protein
LSIATHVMWTKEDRCVFWWRRRWNGMHRLMESGILIWQIVVSISLYHSVSRNPNSESPQWERHQQFADRVVYSLW